MESTLPGGRVSISNSEFRGSTQNAVYSNLESDLTISGTDFYDNYIAALLERSRHSEGGRVNVTLTDVFVNSTGTAAVQLYPRNADITFNRFISSQNKGKCLNIDVRDSANSASTISILGSRFVNNEAYSDVISIMARNADIMTLEVKDTVLDDNIYGIQINCYTGTSLIICTTYSGLLYDYSV